MEICIINENENKTILDGCKTKGYKWDGLEGREISGLGYAQSTFGAKNKIAHGKKQKCSNIATEWNSDSVTKGRLRAGQGN